MNNRVSFQNIDRILRIIYRELSLDEHLNYTEFSKGELKNVFDLRSATFRSRVTTSYLSTYPDNYHHDDLDNLLTELARELDSEFHSTNVLFMIPYIAKRIIQRRSDELFIDFNDLLEWDGFINKIELKLFLGAYFAMCNHGEIFDFTCTALKNNNKYVMDILSRNGISENHMHLKASGYSEDINWYHFLELSIFEKSKFKAFCSEPGIFRELPKTDENLDRLVQYMMKIKFLRFLLKELGPSEKKKVEFKMMDIETLLCSKDLEIDLFSLNGKNSKKIRESLMSENIILKRNFKKLFEKHSIFAYGQVELKFLTDFFTYILSHVQTSESLIYLMNLYICGAGRVKFQFVQDNIGMGFSKFKEKEDNKTWFVPDQGKGKKDVIQSVFNRYYHEGNINKVELRIAPKNSKNEYIEFLKDLEEMNDKEYEQVKKHNKKIKKISYGVIVHFIKPLNHKDQYDKSQISLEKVRSKERAEKYYCRSFFQREQCEMGIDVLISTIGYINDLAEKEQLGTEKKYSINESEEKTRKIKFSCIKDKLVGIDTANYELNNRPEIYACAFRKYRDASYNQFPQHITYHVGEEFPTLSDGVRAIDEAITFLGYERNDRLGHALALGIDPRDYYKKKRNNIFTTIQDYVDDIVWMYQTILTSSYSNPQLTGYLEQEYECSRHRLFNKRTLFSEIPSLADYAAAYYLRGDCPEVYRKNLETDVDYSEIVKQFGYKLNSHEEHHENSFMNKKARALYFAYHFNWKLKDAGRKEIRKEVDELFLQCLEVVQKILKEKIREKNIFIEANPSSNKKISSVKHYSNLPVIQMNKYGLSCDKEFIHLPVSINTDDSGIFQTNLSNEYAMIAAALIRDDYDEFEVYRYIENLAIASNVHSFIRN